jgi:quercetin dioxygenase-like cupin family protein
MSHLSNLSEYKTQRIWGDMTARGVQGDQLTLGILELDPNGEVPEHSHDETEQIGICVSGTIIWTAGGETRTMKPGGIWVFPPNTPHSCKAGPEGAVLIEGFSPPRSDWQQFELQAPSTPRWPA